MEKTVLADGTIFFNGTIDDKLVLKNPIPCMDPTHAGIRRWYDTFGETMRSHGVFVLPFWLFRKNHGREWGFTIGDTSDDDVPTPLRMTVIHSNTLLYQVLSQKGMFPPGSAALDHISQCCGEGYKALKSIIMNSHPIFHDQPSTLTRNYPTQGDRSILKYKMLFEDFLQLRAFVNKFTQTLDDEDCLDIFIANMKYSDYIN
jgi:hypothetical protein